MQTYDPLHDPFDLPVEILALHCGFERELVLPEREGANLHTTLRGAFGSALVAEGCALARSTDSTKTCIDRQGRGGCERPSACALPWLYEPRVASQRRDHPSPVVLRIEGVDSEVRDEEVLVSALRLSLFLLGRHATRGRELVLRALGRTGKRGLTEPRGRGPLHPMASFDVRFSSTYVPVFAGTLGAWVAARRGKSSPKRVGIELASPLVASPPDLAALLGNTAHDLVQWDLADRGLSDAWGEGAKQRCDELSDSARSQVAEWGRRLRSDGHTKKVGLGRRRSVSTQQRFPLGGEGAFTGWLELRGALDLVLPWLVVLELRGGGAKKSFGMGEVRLRLG